MYKKIVFMGSSDFSVPILEALAQKYKIVGVVTQPDKPAGRGKKFTASPVKEFADQQEFFVSQPRNISDENFIRQMEDWRPDLVVVAAYGKIIPPAILNIPEFGCVNVHASLLPCWRGASPIQAAILHGEEQTGVTIILMDEGMDTGDILSSQSVAIKSNDTYATLSWRLSLVGADLLIHTLPDYFFGKMQQKPQNNSAATYSGTIQKSDGLLDFQNPAELLERKIRAYNPWPVSFMKWNGENLRIFQAIISDKNDLKPGRRGIQGKSPAVGSSNYDLILIEVQPPGKKKMSGKAFLNGARNWVE